METVHNAVAAIQSYNNAKDKGEFLEGNPRVAQLLTLYWDWMEAENGQI